MLEGLRAPLLGTASRDDRTSGTTASPGHVAGVDGDGISLGRSNSLSRISERRLSAQLSGTTLANRMAHVSRDLHGLLQDSSVNLISPDVRVHARTAMRCAREPHVVYAGARVPCLRRSLR